MLVHLLDILMHVIGTNFNLLNNWILLLDQIGHLFRKVADGN